MDDIGNTTLVFTGAFLVVSGIVIYNRKGKGRVWPPAAPKVPVLGSFPFIGSDVPKGLVELRNKLGPIYTVHFGNHRIVVLGSYELLKEAFVKNAYAFSGRVQPTPMEYFGAEGFGCRDADTRPHWMVHRKTAVTALVEFGMGNSSVVEGKILTEMEYLVKEILKHSSNAFDVTPFIGSAVANIISSMMFGKRFEYDDPEFIELGKIRRELFGKTADMGIAMNFPWVKHIPGDFFGQKALERLGARFEEIFVKKVREHQTSYDPNVTRDIIDVFIREQQRLQAEGKGERMTDAVITGSIADVFSGGSETIPTQLTWAIIIMIRYPEIQRKVQQEIDDVVGCHGDVHMTQSQDMPYTNAVLMEIQRYSDIVPFSVMHRVIKPVELAGYKLEKGTTILPLASAVNVDANIWEKPHEFHPKHFLNDDGSFKKRDEFIGFSFGRRVCPGEPLARMQLFLFFVSVLQRFTFTVGKGEDMPGYAHDLGITRMNHPFKVGVIDRWEGTEE